MQDAFPGGPTHLRDGGFPQRQLAEVHAPLAQAEGEAARHECAAGGGADLVRVVVLQQHAAVG